MTVSSVIHLTMTEHSCNSYPYVNGQRNFWSTLGNWFLKRNVKCKRTFIVLNMDTPTTFRRPGCPAHVTLVSTYFTSRDHHPIFPSNWKTATPHQVSVLRSMLDTIEKLFEKLIKSRLTDAIRAAENYSPRQHVFRAGRYTIDAIKKLVPVERLAEPHSRNCRRG